MHQTYSRSVFQVPPTQFCGPQRHLKTKMKAQEKNLVVLH